ncbi:L-fucokinase-domain-containing protein [Hyaloraphidium curvatum]|nr:L-fucokinase-domain-containing protein [Hyaloraphidium curvatum]
MGPRTRPDFARAQRRRSELFSRILADPGDGDGRPTLPFWDAVVLTAGDEQQKAVYEGILDRLTGDGLLPTLGTKYHVLMDPPGPKIGSGGSTLVVLDALSKAYGAHLRTMQILLLHAGGYSKRLPHVSACGKIFAAVPIENALGRAMTVFELKLVLYVDFPRKMEPGFFLASADTIESFTETYFDFTLPGFTALAHPSPLKIGISHGVFVLPHTPFPCSGPSDVKTFIHKPRVPLMLEHGANFSFGGEDHVLTDSCYFAHHGTYDALLHALKELQPLRAELEAYGDVLSPLGTHPHHAHLDSGANLVDPAGFEAVREARRVLWARLEGTPLRALALEESGFHHLGTAGEYLTHLCGGEVAVDAGFVCRAGGRGEVKGAVCMDVVVDDGADAQAEAPCVVERSRIGKGAKLRVGKGSILANLEFAAGEWDVPAGSYLFSVPLADGHVGFAIGCSDDLKLSQEKVLLFSGRVAAQDVARLSGHDGMAEGDSIWTARIWPVLPSRAACTAFAVSAAQLGAGSVAGGASRGTRLVSIAEAVAQKSVDGVLRQLRGDSEHGEVRE